MHAWKACNGGSGKDPGARIVKLGVGFSAEIILATGKENLAVHE